jgi:hypothetical protein
MAWRVGSVAAGLIPFVAALAGIGLSIWRFRTRDQMGGLVYGLGGMLLMLVLAIWLDRHTLSGER